MPVGRLTLNILLGLLAGACGLPLHAADPFPGQLPGTRISDGLPVGFEPSGAVWHPRLGRLFVVDDGGAVAAMDRDGFQVTTWDVPGDLEAVCVADAQSDIVYAGDENAPRVRELDLETGQVLRVFRLLEPDPGGDGLEALTFVPVPGHPEGGHFYAGLQSNGTVYVFDLPIRTSSTSVVVSLVRSFTPVPGRVDLSGLHYDEYRHSLFAIYDDPNLIREMTLDGDPLGEWELPGSTQEGVTVIGCDLVIAEDRGQVWRYRFFPDNGDSDSDGVTDCDDNCPVTENQEQADQDSDGAGDRCDCAPQEPLVQGAPGELSDLRVEQREDRDETKVSWQGPGERFDVAAGLILDLRGAGGVDDAECLVDNETESDYSDLRPDPVAGNGYYYVVRAENDCGSGGYGRSTAGVERTPLNDCP